MLVTLLCFGVYLHRTLKGDVDHHILAGEMFGVPAEIAAHGVKPLYHGEGMTGWDGQFYYYISNDLLGTKDTPQHLDTPAYRYQRIGLPLFAAAAAAVTGQSWVSPTFYLASYFCLVSAAVWVGSRLFAGRDWPGPFILVWGLSVGTQITVFNALPDAAADAFLILGLALCFSPQRLWAALPFSLAALSREIYVLFPAAILLAEFLALVLPAWKQRQRPAAIAARVLATGSLYVWLLPLVALAGWQLHLKLHFGTSAGSGARGILGAPLAAWWDYFQSGLTGRHKLLGVSRWAGWESASLLTFLLVLATAIALPAARLRRGAGTLPAVDQAVLGSTLFLGLFYCCFGPVVMMHYTGYVKAIGVFGILLPLCASAGGVRSRGWRRVVMLVLLLNLGVTASYNWKSRIIVPDTNFDLVTGMSSVSRTDEQACIADPRASFRLLDRSAAQAPTGRLEKLFGKGSLVRARVQVGNAGSTALVSSRARGGVFVSYQWFDASGRMVGDGIRSALLQPLQPGAQAEVGLVSYLPTRPGRYTMRVSAVQEGCGWFFQTHAGSALDLEFEVGR